MEAETNFLFYALKVPRNLLGRIKIRDDDGIVAMVH